MVPEGSLPILQKPSTCHYAEQWCVTADRNGWIFVLTTMRNKPDVIIHGMESLVVVNISEYRAVAMYSEP